MFNLFSNEGDNNDNESPYYSSSTDIHDIWYSTDGSTYGGSFVSSSDDDDEE